jgi:hypothetical protein
MTTPNYKELHAQAILDKEARQRTCFANHVEPLLALMGLPVGTVITKEYSDSLDSDFWEVTIGLDKYQGPDIVALLKSIPQKH